MKKTIFVCVLIMMGMLTSSLSAQRGQETADAFLKRVSDGYAKIKDYRANVFMFKQGVSQNGTLYYVAPDRLKIEYRVPQRQVLLITENHLQLYLPEYEVIMEQRLSGKTSEDMAGIGVGRGLEVLQKNYSVSYVNNANPQPLAPGSAEMVIKLQLRWRVNSEGFRSLEISINPQTLLIRRVSGVTSLFENIQFDFTGITLDSNIPKTIFTIELDDTSRVNRYPDFIFGYQEGS
ncbi:MAG: LolA family protein [Spirochaetia bacterium]